VLHKVLEKRAQNADCADARGFARIELFESHCFIRVDPRSSAFIRVKRSFFASAAN
jgi:hypothetical protein